MIFDKSKAFIVGLETRDFKPNLEELASLATTFGFEVVKKYYLKGNIRPRFLIGKGKVDEILAEMKEAKVNTLIFDNNLMGSQINAWFNYSDNYGFYEFTIMDRRELICEIFRKHAQTMEGKLQTEYAYWQVKLAQLKGVGKQLSRTAGGIGTKGAGEQKIEKLRRSIRRKLYNLKDKLEKVLRISDIKRAERLRYQRPLVTVVGYTNAGKSTFFKNFAKADVYVADKLFATLSNKTRKVYLNSEKYIFLTDTIGFIRNLPHQLVEAFKATLKEAILSDTLLIVLNALYWEEELEVVNSVLNEIEAPDNRIYVLNKIDLIDNPQLILNRLPHPAIAISAKERIGFDELKKLLLKQVYGL